MIWSSFDLEFASEDRDCDLIITDSRDGVEVYCAWEADDDESVLIIDDRAPESLYDFACAEDGWDEVLWEDEAERTHVKYAVKEVREETTFYLNDPPEHAYTDIGRLEALEILSRRGIETENLEDSWYYPMLNEAAFLFIASDSHGETYRTLRTVSRLDEVEKGLVEGEWPDEDELEEKSLAVLQEEIYRQSDFGELKAGVLACWKKGIRQNAVIAEKLGIGNSAVSTTVYQITQKLEKRQWEQDHVYPHVPEEKRPDGLLIGE